MDDHRTFGGSGVSLWGEKPDEEGTLLLEDRFSRWRQEICSGLPVVGVDNVGEQLVVAERGESFDRTVGIINNFIRDRVSIVVLLDDSQRQLLCDKIRVELSPLAPEVQEVMVGIVDKIAGELRGDTEWQEMENLFLSVQRQPYSQPLYEKLISLEKSLRGSAVYGFILGEIGKCARFLGKKDEAKDYLEKAFEISSSREVGIDLAVDFSNNYKKGDHNDEEKAGLKKRVMDILEKVSEDRTTSMTLAQASGIVVTLLNVGEVDMAIKEINVLEGARPTRAIIAVVESSEFRQLKGIALMLKSLELEKSVGSHLLYDNLRAFVEGMRPVVDGLSTEVVRKKEMGDDKWKEEMSLKIIEIFRGVRPGRANMIVNGPDDRMDSVSDWMRQQSQESWHDIVGEIVSHLGFVVDGEEVDYALIVMQLKGMMYLVESLMDGIDSSVVRDNLKEFTEDMAGIVKNLPIDEKK